MVARWQDRAVNVVLVVSVVVAAVVMYSAVVQRGQSDVLDRIDKVTTSQHASAESTECAREINSAGEVAQLEAQSVLRAAFLDSLTDGDVGQDTIGQVVALDATLAEARAGYLEINDRCPVPDG